MYERPSTIETKEREAVLKCYSAKEDKYGKENSVFSDDAILMNQDMGIFGVFDGVSGHEGGKVASHKAAEIFKKIAEGRRDLKVSQVKELMAFAVKRMHKSIVEEGIRISKDGYEHDRVDKMATTACMAEIVEAEGKLQAIIANVGDSRAYLVKAGKRMRQLTQDKHEFLGWGAEKVPDAEIIVIDIEPGDGLLLTTDGLLKNLTEQEIEFGIKKALANGVNPAEVIATTRGIQSIWERSRAKKLPDKTADGEAAIKAMRRDDMSAVYVKAG